MNSFEEFIEPPAMDICLIAFIIFFYCDVPSLVCALYMNDSYYIQSPIRQTVVIWWHAAKMSWLVGSSVELHSIVTYGMTRLIVYVTKSMLYEYVL